MDVGIDEVILTKGLNFTYSI